MRRRCALAAIALTLCGCQFVSRRVLVPVPPETAGAWVRRGLETANPADAPEPMRTLRPEAWVRATYYHEREAIEVNAYGFKSSAQALESAQKWQASERAVVSLRGSIFIVYSSLDANRDELRTFMRGMEEGWFGRGR